MDFDWSDEDRAERRKLWGQFDRSGNGQVIHLSQLETTVASIGRLMVEHAVTGEEPKRLGNGEPDKAPYGCFPCEGDDRWVVLCVEDDEDWLRLRALLGEPDWAANPRYDRAPGRVADRADLEGRIAAWTSGRNDYAVVNEARALGLPAGVVQNTEDMLRRDPQLEARCFFEDIPHFKRGQVTASGIPLGLTGTPGRTTYAGSSVGHDNDYVFRSDNIQALSARLEGDDVARYGWDIDTLEWRTYWVDVVYPGILTWTMPELHGKDAPLDPPMAKPLDLAPKTAAKTTKAVS